ncbi:MAG: universal stress protein [Sedimenticolaceae bacterium]
MKEPQRIVPRILVPTDFSAASERAFFCALALAVARQARLTMLHTGRESRDVIPWDQFPGIRETLTQWRWLPADAPRTAVAETLNVGVAKMGMRESDPRRGIADYLRRHPADLIVMATAGRRGLARRLLGPSVAETVCHLTRTHSLMLPKRGPDLIDPATGRGCLKRVLYVVAPKRDPRADLIFIGRWLPPLSDGDLQIALLQTEDADDSATYALPQMPRLEWGWEQREGEGSAAIIAAAQATDAELVVLPTRLRRRDTEETLRALRLPLLVIPAF